MMISELRSVLESLETNVCLSGGAKGADRLFGLWSTANGHEQLHFSFPRHHCGSASAFEVKLNEEQLNEDVVKKLLRLANRTLSRQVPHSSTYVYKLLARNTWQIFATDKVYAIGKLASPSVLDGGTSWAVQMYLELCKERECDATIYLYEMDEHAMYQYCNKSKQFIPCKSVPTPSGIWTGIGSRNATESHIKEMCQYFS